MKVDVTLLLYRLENQEAGPVARVSLEVKAKATFCSKIKCKIKDTITEAHYFHLIFQFCSVCP
jgi:hypothetical protein